MIIWNCFWSKMVPATLDDNLMRLAYRNFSGNMDRKGRPNPYERYWPPRSSDLCDLFSLSGYMKKKYIA